MPHLGPRMQRMGVEARALRDSLPPQVRDQLKVGGFISKDSVVGVLRNDAVWGGLTSVPTSQLDQTKRALLDFLANATGSDPLDTLALRRVDVDGVGPQKYAASARKALLSYLPREDVDSARAIKKYLSDPDYAHQLLEGKNGAAHYTAGFFHTLAVEPAGGVAKAIQLDYHSLLEGKPPDLAGGKVALDRFLADTQAKHGRADFLFVEVTPGMRELYLQIDANFQVFAEPGTKNAGDKYQLLALPLTPSGRRALKDNAKNVLNAYVDQWFHTNAPPGWEGDPKAKAAYDEMKNSPALLWNQPPLP